MTATLSDIFCNSLLQEICFFKNSTEVLMYGDDHQEEVIHVQLHFFNAIFPVLMQFMQYF